MHYLNWLQKESNLSTLDGKEIEVYSFNYDFTNQRVLSEWAMHFRQQYCDDSIIDKIKPQNLSRKDYLITLKFPDEKASKKDKRGPGVRAGDFAEIMIADFLEFTKGYWVPRTRYNRKVTKNSSTPGCDVLAFKMENTASASPDDCFLIIEVKAGFSKNKKNFSRLQNAVNDSSKDCRRKAESLNALKQTFLDNNSTTEFNMINRFQQEVDFPYKQIYGAASLFSNCVFSDTEVQKTDCTNHSNKDKLKLLVIKGADMMNLVNAIYNRAANEA